MRHLRRVPQPERPLPIALQIVTGYLGAGKTTLLNRLLKAPEWADTVVIVNEFGEIGLDHLLMEGGSASGDGMILMESGCLCCTIRGDLVNTLEDLLRRRDNGRIAPFRRVVIETTGIADPVPIIQTALGHPYLSMRYFLDGVIAVLDAVNGLATLEASEEALRQVAVADCIVVTKTDLVPDGAMPAGLSSALASINPAVKPLLAARGEAEAGKLVGLGLFDLAAKPPEVEAWLAIEAALGAGRREKPAPGAPGGRLTAGPVRHGDVVAFALTADKPVKADTLDLFWSLLRSTHGPKLLRLKGIVDLAERRDGPVILHAAQMVMHPPAPLAAWPSADRRTRLVIIGRGLDPAAIAKLWAAFLGQG
jgi:G3E family GTPase